MKNSRSLMQASALAALALAVAACAATDTADATAKASAADDDGDTITLAANTAGTPVALPYKSGFGMSKHLISRPFEVRPHSSVTVTAQARWATPDTCHEPTFSITLYTATEQGPGRALASRTFPASGVAHTETWRDLPAGEYTLELDTQNRVSSCHLIGALDVVDR